MDMKDFKEIEGYPNYYIAHSPPRVFRKVDGEFLECKQTANSKKDNYWTVTLRNEDGKFVKRSVHRLLMLTFVPNPEGKSQVNHIDGDKSNNSLDNLEWVTPKENSEHAVRSGLKDIRATDKEIHQYTLSGDYVRSYFSGTEASRVTNISAENLRSCALGRRNMAGDFQWSYKNLDRMPPCKVKYLDYYEYGGKKFKTLGELASYLGESGDTSKIGFKWFKKSVREGITTVYKT